MKKKKLNKKGLLPIISVSLIMGVVLPFIGRNIESVWVYLFVSALVGIIIGLSTVLLLRWIRKRKENNSVIKLIIMEE